MAVSVRRPGATLIKDFDIHAIVSTFLILIVPAAGGGIGSVVCYIVLTLFALTSYRGAIQALTLSTILTVLNPAIYSIEGSALRWLVLLSAVISVWGRRALPGLPGQRLPFVIVPIFAFAFFAGLTGVIWSSLSSIAGLKALSFFLFTSTIIVGFANSHRSQEWWTRWLLSVFAVLLFLGFLFVASSIGYARNGRAFQGLVNHPQLHSIIIAPALVLVILGLLTKNLRSYGWWLVVAVGLISLVLSLSRTALLATVVGVSIGMLAAIVFGRGGRGRTLGILTAILFGSAALIVVAPGVVDSAMETARSLIYKGGGSSFAATVDDRQVLIDQSLANFRANPTIGIGLGVPSDRYFAELETVLGVPISASVEKTNFYSGILEETGAIGAALMAIIMVSLMGTAFKYGGAGSFALVVSILISNLGEATFASVGGAGGWQWLLIGAVVAIKPPSVVRDAGRARPWHAIGSPYPSSEHRPPEPTE